MTPVLFAYSLSLLVRGGPETHNAQDWGIYE